MKLDKDYWSNRYNTGETGWDIGYISTPLKEYFDTLKDKNISILIPGGGNAYEAEYLHNKGFQNVYLLDISMEPITNFLKRVPDFDSSHCICENFFDHNIKYDLIIEQTFFCALDPTLREDYITKMCALLKPKGKLVGLLFNIPLNNDKPPFGGNKEEYIKLFAGKMHLNKMEIAENSIGPRAGNELFFEATCN